MTTLLAVVDEVWASNWGQLGAGALIALAAVWGLNFIRRSTRFMGEATDVAIGRYQDVAVVDANRITSLEMQVHELKEKVDGLEADYREQRDLKHRWRSFSSSLLQERWTIRQFCELYNCTEIIELMERLDELRRDHPLMADAESMSEGDPI